MVGRRQETGSYGLRGLRGGEMGGMGKLRKMRKGRKGEEGEIGNGKLRIARIARRGNGEETGIGETTKGALARLWREREIIRKMNLNSGTHERTGERRREMGSYGLRGLRGAVFTTEGAHLRQGYGGQAEFHRGDNFEILECWKSPPLCVFASLRETAVRFFHEFLSSRLILRRLERSDGWDGSDESVIYS